MVSTTTRTHVTRRNFIRGLGLMSVASALAACTQTDGGAGTTDVAAPATPLLAIIHTNDVHGHVVAKQSKDGTWKGFSMAAVPALRRHWQDLGYEVLLVDAGDTMQGTPLVDTSRGALGIELMTVGNHDFDWGPEATAANETSANFPFLSANVLRKGDGTVRFVPNTVVELADGTKVGFFGLTTPSTRSTTSPRNVADLDFLTGDDLIACAQEQVEDLRGQGAEIVVCVGHLGSVPIEGGSSKDVLEKVAGIDLFIDGHDHREVNEKVEETTLVEAGSYLSDIGVVAIEKGLPSAELVAAGTFDGIDETVQALVDKLDADTDVLLSEVMGVTPFFPNGRYDPELGCVETNLCDFCADAFRWKASYELGREIDAAIINDSGVRASIEAGDVTIKVIKTVLPFSDEIMVIDVTGAQLLEAIEAGCC